MDKEHPIVERPDWFFDLAYPGGSKMPMVKRYIEQLEGQLSFDQERNMELHECQETNRTILNELHQAQAIIEGLTAERDRAEADLKNVR